MKKLTACVCVLALLVSLCGCSAKTEKLEIKHRLIVQAMGIDKGENGKIRLSVQTLNTDVATNASSNTTPEKLVRCYTAEGATLAECTEKLTLMTGKNPMLSQNRIVIFSSELAREGIGSLLDSFVRNNENRFNVCAALSNGNAHDIIEADFGDNVIGARLIQQMLESAGFETVKTKIYDVTNCILDGNKSAVLPILAAGENGIIYDGIGVFRGDRLFLTLAGEAARGINLINNAVQSGMLNAGNVSLNILKSRTAVKAKLKDGAPSFEIKVEASLAVSEITADINGKLNTEGIVNIRELCENTLKSYIQNALTQCIIEGNADTFGFSRRIWRRFPDFYRNNENGLLKNADYCIEVKVKIVRTGDSVIKR